MVLEATQPDLVDIGRHNVSGLGLRLALFAKAEGDVLGNREPGKQGIALEHHAAIGPGRVTALPSSTMVPVVGVSRPATMRRRVDFPQPDGPRMVTKSLSPIVRLVGCNAVTGCPPWTPGKTRETFWITSLLMPASRGRADD